MELVVVKGRLSRICIALQKRVQRQSSQTIAQTTGSLGNSQREYEKAVVLYSVKHQLRYKPNLVRHVYKKEERHYYEELLRYSREHLMLYPYHLSDVMVKGLRNTPFAYYVNTMTDIMNQEKSYDSLPNFTAADCLRLMGIGRNQYIDLMNQCRSSKKFFRKKPVRDLLPAQPIEEVSIDPWWKVHVGYITEDDIKNCAPAERKTIDMIIDKGPKVAADLDHTLVHGLYRKGLVYLEVPIADEDCIIVPPLEGFVMNRVLGDYFETLLYKIFVSIDEHTTVAELASVLEIDLELVKNAVSMYCRLGFAKKKGVDLSPEDIHPSWKNYRSNSTSKKPTADQLLIDWTSLINEEPEDRISPDTVSLEERVIEPPDLMNVSHSKRIAFIFDSTLTAFLMMGNLSPGLKSHAVTMFEVGKLSDESLDSFLSELEKIYNADAEGEAQRYFEHAVTLRDTIRFLRHNSRLGVDDKSETGQGIDLLRCESLLGLDPATCARVLNKNYSLLISMAPLSNEIRPISSCSPQHLGPTIPEVNSVWFKLFLYHMTGCGPPSLLLVKGFKLRKLPKVFQRYDKLLVTTWGHDPGVIPTSNILLTLNDALTHSSVLVQGHSLHGQEGEVRHVPFPFVDQKNSDVATKAIEKIGEILDVKHNCGYITLLHSGYVSNSAPASTKHSTSHCDNNTKKETAGNTMTPRNGIHDPVSAQMLCSELDLLENSPATNTASLKTSQIPSSSAGRQEGHPTNISSNTSDTRIDRTRLNLELNEDKKVDHSSASVRHETREADWVVLECCFGVPLFAAELNSQVCNKILENSLCKKESLQELLHSSRQLSLKLLSFIAENQDLPVIQENNHESGMIPSAGLNVQQTVPLPTHNLLFSHHGLQTWTGK